MKNIIVISGKQYSGKDTLAKILLDNLDGFKRIGIGDAIKIKYAKDNNLTFDEIEKNKHLYRDDLIKLGNWGRDIDPEYWLRELAKNDNIIVPDMRVIDEFTFFKRQGAYMVRVEASFEARSKRGIIVNNDDETETMLDYRDDWDYIVDNNSDYENLVQKAGLVLESFKTFAGLQ